MKKLSASIYPRTIPQKARFTADTAKPAQFLTRIVLVISYLVSCVRRGAIPWHYFQLNGAYFNTDKGIFSKLDIDKVIPARWRLKQRKYDSQIIPKRYPVFLKPEWGQNSNGIRRIENSEQYLDAANCMNRLGMAYIVQEAAPAEQEFELYFQRSAEDYRICSFLSITQVINSSDESYPINSIHNRATSYREITSLFSQNELAVLWQYMAKIGTFRMARVGIKATSREALLQGEFKIVEINLFLPMPLVLLADNVSGRQKFAIIRRTMMLAAGLVKTIPRHEKKKWIFWRKMLAHYKV